MALEHCKQGFWACSLRMEMIVPALLQSFGVDLYGLNYGLQVGLLREGSCDEPCGACSGYGGHGCTWWGDGTHDLFVEDYSAHCTGVCQVGASNVSLVPFPFDYRQSDIRILSIDEKLWSAFEQWAALSPYLENNVEWVLWDVRRRRAHYEAAAAAEMAAAAVTTTTTTTTTTTKSKTPLFPLSPSSSLSFTHGSTHSAPPAVGPPGYPAALAAYSSPLRIDESTTMTKQRESQKAPHRMVATVNATSFVGSFLVSVSLGEHDNLNTAGDLLTAVATILDNAIQNGNLSTDLATACSCDVTVTSAVAALATDLYPTLLPTVLSVAPTTPAPSALPTPQPSIAFFGGLSPEVVETATTVAAATVGATVGGAVGASVTTATAGSVASATGSGAAGSVASGTASGAGAGGASSSGAGAGGTGGTGGVGGSGAGGGGANGASNNLVGDPLSLLFAAQSIGITAKLSGMTATYKNDFASSFSTFNLQMAPPKWAKSGMRMDWWPGSFFKDRTKDNAEDDNQAENMDVAASSTTSVSQHTRSQDPGPKKPEFNNV